MYFCLWLAGMNPFDAVCIAFSTLSAGGFHLIQGEMYCADMASSNAIN